jgi:hypothetical protein
MDDKQQKHFIQIFYPLVTAGGISLKALAKKLGLASSESLRGKAFRLGATGQGDTGKELLYQLNEDGLDVDTFIDQCIADVVAAEVSDTILDAAAEPENKHWRAVNDGEDIETDLPKRTVTFPLTTHREMKMDYSEWGGANLSQAKMAAKYGLTKREFTKYKSIHGWVKAEDGFIDEDILNRDIDELATEVIERRATLQRTFVEKQRDRDATDASKWRALQAGVWEPFSLAVQESLSYKVPKVSFKKSKKAPTRKLIINANDWQIGELAQASELARGDDWNTNLAKEAIAVYAANIAQHIHYSGYNYDEAFICDLGDLGHGLNGYTAHGTPLEVESVRQEQVGAILFCLRALIDSVRQLVPQVHVHHVEGNHLGFTSTLIFDQIAAWYGGEQPVDDVLVHTNYSPVEYVPVGDKTLMVLYHGKTGGPGRGMAMGGAKRERDAYHLIMEGVRRYPDNRNVNLLTGHIHHRLLEEFSDVTIHTLGTIAAGDFYADQNLLTGCPPTQNIMDVDPTTGLITSVPVSVVAL